MFYGTSQKNTCSHQKFHKMSIIILNFPWLNDAIYKGKYKNLGYCANTCKKQESTSEAESAASFPGPSAPCPHLVLVAGQFPAANLTNLQFPADGKIWRDFTNRTRED